MSSQTSIKHSPHRNVLSGDLVLRRATVGDRDALIQLQASVHAGPDGQPSAAVAAWTRDLFDRPHPAMQLNDITVVENQRTGALVSSLALMRQRWHYAGIPIGVGRLELVATHPEYRRRGLINHQLRALHEQSTNAGDLLQAITDLMFFHGEFGYHMAMVQRAGFGGAVKQLPPAPDSGEPVQVRPATLGDIPVLADLDRRMRDNVLLSCPRDEQLWHHELTGHSVDSMMHDRILLVEQDARPVGYVLLGYGGIPTFPIPEWLPGLPCPERALSISGIELLPQVSQFDVAPSILRHLIGDGTYDGYMLWLGTQHPVYGALAGLLTRQPPHASWFIRVPDLTRFIAAVGPALEQRLSRSTAQDHTGELRLHFYTYGIRLYFENGQLVEVEPWPSSTRRTSDASMPEQMFIQIMLGHANIADIATAYPDFRLQTPTGKALLPILFPKQQSRIWPVA